MKRLFLLWIIFSAVVLLADDIPKYDWSKAEKLHDDILHAYIYPKKPRPMKIHTVRIDLKSASYDLIATPKDKDFGKPMPDYPQLPIQTRRLTVRDFMMQKRSKGHEVLIAVNATPWSPWCKPFNHIYGGNINLVISNGEIVADKKKNTPAFAVTKDGRIEIRTIKADEDRTNFKIALAGFSIILKNGNVSVKYKDYHPRTCYGISQDGRYLYFMTIDGRQKFISEGASVVECAEFMRYFGAYDAQPPSSTGTRKNKKQK